MTSELDGMDLSGQLSAENLDPQDQESLMLQAAQVDGQPAPAQDLEMDAQAQQMINENDGQIEQVSEEISDEVAAESGKVSERPEGDTAVSQGEKLASEDAGPLDAAAVVKQRLNEFRRELRMKEGHWYIVHAYSGHERKVKANLEQRANSLGMASYIHEVVVPMEEVIEMKNTQRKRISRVRMPGYVMVRMSLDADNNVLRLVKDTPAITGFVGDSKLKDREDQIPTPLSTSEAYDMLAPQVEQETLAELEAAAIATPERAIKVEYEVGEIVTVINGPFAGQSATVAEVMPESKKLVVTLTLFGRDTSTELAMEDVRKED